MFVLKNDSHPIVEQNLTARRPDWFQGRLKEAQKAVDGVNMVDPGVHPVEVLVL